MVQRQCVESSKITGKSWFHSRRPQKNTGMSAGRGYLVLIVLLALAAAVNCTGKSSKPADAGSGSGSTASTTAAEPADPKTSAIAHMKVKIVPSRADGVMTVNLEVENSSEYNVRSLEITCNARSPRGADQGIRKARYDESVNAHATTTISDIDLIASFQVPHSSCEVTDVELAP